MTDNALKLDETITQAAFGRLFGVSQQAVAKAVEKGVLRMGDTLGQWIIQYAAHLREIAAGRGGEDQYDLTKQKARQAEADANLKELEYWTRLERFVSVDELEPLLASWAATARSEVENAVERIVNGVESRYGIEIEREIIDAPLNAAFDAIAAYPGVATSGDDKGGEEMGATT